MFLLHMSVCVGGGGGACVRSYLEQKGGRGLNCEVNRLMRAPCSGRRKEAVWHAQIKTSSGIS